MVFFGFFLVFLFCIGIYIMVMGRGDREIHANILRSLIKNIANQELTFLNRSPTEE